MKTIKQVLMERDGCTERDADERIDIAREKLNDLLDQGETGYAYDICMDHFGLEPDYLDELMY